MYVSNARVLIMKLTVMLLLNDDIAQSPKLLQAKGELVSLRVVN